MEIALKAEKQVTLDSQQERRRKSRNKDASPDFVVDVTSLEI
jgi:hypothetical protein